MASLSNYLPEPAAKLLENLKNTHDLLRASARINRPGKAKSLLILTIPEKSHFEHANSENENPENTVKSSNLSNSPKSSPPSPLSPHLLPHELYTSDYESEYEPPTIFSKKVINLLDYHKDTSIFPSWDDRERSWSQFEVVPVANVSPGDTMRPAKQDSFRHGVIKSSTVWVLANAHNSAPTVPSQGPPPGPCHSLKSCREWYHVSFNK